MSIGDTIRAYHGDLLGDPHHRYRSWEHCYSYFRQTNPRELAAQKEVAALQLGFYLASWGMYRGSSFLLRHAYTVHVPVIDLLTDAHFSPLWVNEFGAVSEDRSLIPVVLEAFYAIREVYQPFQRNQESGQATDTLVTKVILGTLGCLPACDDYFRKGFKSRYQYSYVNRPFIERILEFTVENLTDIRAEQERIKNASGIYYPLMKLVDMYFFQLGNELVYSRSD